MDNSNPYQSPPIEADVEAAGRSVRAMPWGGRALGVFASIWGFAAWFEWFLVPLLMTNSDGPVPHLAFGPQALALFLGCVVLSALSMLHAMLENRLWQILYALPAASYIVYQVWRFW